MNPIAKLRHFAFYRRPIDAPSVLIVAAWLALWMVWPWGGSRPARVRIPGSMQVRYVDPGGAESYRRPTAFLFAPGLAGSGPAARDFGEIQRVAHRPRRRMLDNVAGVFEPVPLESASPARDARDSLGEYSSLWIDSPAFMRAGGGQSRLVVWCSDALRDAGFRLADVLEAEMVSGKSWEVVLEVEAAAGGRIEHVFVINSSGDSSIDAGLVRAAYRATLPGATPGLRGRVTIGCERQ